MYVQNVTILEKIEKIRSFSRKIINLLSFHIFDYLAEICVEYLNSKFVATWETLPIKGQYRIHININIESSLFKHFK